MSSLVSLNMPFIFHFVLGELGAKSGKACLQSNSQPTLETYHRAQGFRKAHSSQKKSC
jgi:hypothetical protein